MRRGLSVARGLGTLEATRDYKGRKGGGPCQGFYHPWLRGVWRGLGTRVEGRAGLGGGQVSEIRT